MCEIYGDRPVLLAVVMLVLLNCVVGIADTPDSRVAPKVKITDLSFIAPIKGIRIVKNSHGPKLTLSLPRPL